MTLEFSSKVTIMIPTYNQASFIKKSVNSALSQSYPNLEILVGDDASTDSTVSIIKKINDPRIKYIKNSKNLGRVNNYKNLLYEHASGDYILNLDGDDYYTDKNFVSDAISIIKKNRELVRTNAVMGLGIAYAGSAREDLLDLLIPIVVDTTISVELSAMAALSLGLIFVGKCTEEVTNAILETLTERPENILDISIARFFSLGMGLLFLG